MPSTTFTDLRAELSARGFSYLDGSAADQARRDAFINDGYRDLCFEEEWDFLLATTTPGTAPITVTDLRLVQSVYAGTTELEQRDRSDLTPDDPSLTQTGTAQYWWRDGQSTIRVYPLDASTTWTVRYLKVPAALSSGSDTPVVPDEWRHLIVDYAVIRALRDRSNYQEADALYQAIQPDLARMRDALLDFVLYQRQTDSQAA